MGGGQSVAAMHRLPLYDPFPSSTTTHTETLKSVVVVSPPKFVSLVCSNATCPRASPCVWQLSPKPTLWAFECRKKLLSLVSSRRCLAGPARTHARRFGLRPAIAYVAPLEPQLRSSSPCFPPAAGPQLQAPSMPPTEPRVPRPFEQDQTATCQRMCHLLRENDANGGQLFHTYGDTAAAEKGTRGHGGSSGDAATSEADLASEGFERHPVASRIFTKRTELGRSRLVHTANINKRVAVRRAELAAATAHVQGTYGGDVLPRPSPAPVIRPALEVTPLGTRPAVPVPNHQPASAVGATAGLVPRADRSPANLPAGGVAVVRPAMPMAPRHADPGALQSPVAAPCVRPMASPIAAAEVGVTIGEFAAPPTEVLVAPEPARDAAIVMVAAAATGAVASPTTTPAADAAAELEAAFGPAVSAPPVVATRPGATDADADSAADAAGPATWGAVGDRRSSRHGTVEAGDGERDDTRAGTLPDAPTRDPGSAATVGADFLGVLAAATRTAPVSGIATAQPAAVRPQHNTVAPAAAQRAQRPANAVQTAALGAAAGTRPAVGAGVRPLGSAGQPATLRPAAAPPNRNGISQVTDWSQYIRRK